MTPLEFEKELRKLRDMAKKMGNLKGKAHINQLAFWGLAGNELDSAIREVRQQRLDISDD